MVGGGERAPAAACEERGRPGRCLPLALFSRSAGGVVARPVCFVRVGVGGSNGVGAGDEADDDDDDDGQARVRRRRFQILGSCEISYFDTYLIAFPVAWGRTRAPPKPRGKLPPSQFPSDHPVPLTYPTYLFSFASNRFSISRGLVCNGSRVALRTACALGDNGAGSIVPLPAQPGDLARPLIGSQASANPPWLFPSPALHDKQTGAMDTASNGLLPNRNILIVLIHAPLLGRMRSRHFPPLLTVAKSQTAQLCRTGSWLW